MFGFLGQLASALIPGIGPIISAASTIGRFFAGGGGGGGTGTYPQPPLVPPGMQLVYPTDYPGDKPPGPHLEPIPGWRAPVAEMNGGAVAGGPFVGGDVGTAQPIPDGASGPLDVISAGQLPSFPQPDVSMLPADAGTGGGFNLPALVSGIGNIIQNIPRTIQTALPAAVGGAVVGAGALLASRVLPKVLLGTTIGASIFELYRRLRGVGHSHKRARRIALQAHGIILRRRRMRPTNIHALRRAVRRVRGFRRIVAKVRGVMGTTRLHGGWRPHYRRRGRRGDLNPFMVEDRLDRMDEWEDEGGDEIEDAPFSVGAID